MASIAKNGGRWRVQLYRHGKRESATFRTKAEAAAWAQQREAELTGARLPDKTLDDALARYAAEKAPSLAGSRWAAGKLRNLRAYPLAKKPLTAIAGPDIAEWRDARLSGPRLRGVGSVAPSTVNRELNLLRSVLEAARLDWGWLRVNPMADVKRPKNPPSRRRRISEDEIAAVCAGLGYAGGEPVTLSQRVAVAFLFSLETAMRGGEVVRIRPRDLRPLSVHLPKTKNGDARDVPLSRRARELLALLPDGDPVFGLTDSQRESLFRKGCKRAGVVGLHYHDSRAEAIWRLSKKLDVLELARVIGHRQISSLMHYYDATADELAAKLD
jgi:integrase